MRNLILAWLLLRVRRGQENSGQGCSQNDAEGEGQVPETLRFPVVAEKVVLGRQYRRANVPQILGHPELAACPEQERNYQTDEGAGSQVL